MPPHMSIVQHGMQSLAAFQLPFGRPDDQDVGGLESGWFCIGGIDCGSCNLGGECIAAT